MVIGEVVSDRRVFFVQVCRLLEGSYIELTSVPLTCGCEMSRGFGTGIWTKWNSHY